MKSTHTPRGNRIAHILLWIITVLIVLLFLVEGGTKLFFDPGTIRTFLKWGYPSWFVFVVGVLEFGGAVLILIPRMALLGAAMLVTDMIGAIATGVTHGIYPIIVFSGIILALTIVIGWARRTRFVGWLLVQGLFLTPQDYAPVRWFLIAGLLAIVLTIGHDLITYPVVVTTSGGEGIVYLILFILAILIYSWFALFRTRWATPDERITLRQGTFWGLLCGGAWTIELLVANLPGLPSGWLYLVLYFGSTGIGCLLPAVAALFVAQRTRRIGSGLQAGLLSGMLGGLVIFLASIVLSPVLAAAGQYDPQTLREFHQSGMADLTTFIVGDYLAGMIAHLWIGLIAGLGPGIIASAIGKASIVSNASTG